MQEHQYSEHGPLGYGAAVTVALTGTQLFFVVLLSALSALCLLAAATLVTATPRPRRTLPLAVLFALLAWLASGRIIDAFGGFRAVPVLRAFFLPLLLLGAPLLHWFGRGLLTARPILRLRDLMHLAPAAVTLGFFVVMYGDQDGTGARLRSMVGVWVGVDVDIDDVIRVVYWGFFLQWSAYAMAAIALQSQGRAARRAFFSKAEAAPERRMQYVLMFVLVPWISLWLQLAVSMIGYPRVLEPGASIFRIICLCAFAVYAIRQRWIFELTPQEEASPTPPISQARRSGLDKAALDRIGGKLEAAMARDRLYRNSTLNLRELSDAIQVSEHHISEVLNAHIGESFFDYVNRWRIEEAQHLLMTTDQTVLDILLTVGFNTRSTFNAAFRKRTGTTPTAYRRAVDESAGSSTMDPTNRPGRTP